MFRNLKILSVYFFIGFTFLLAYTRFVNLGWGLPYPMHPDERNMVISILQLKCDTTTWNDCLNPQFFAYGQFPLYLTFFLVKSIHFIQGDIGHTITFEEATFMLRIIAAVSAIVTGWLIYATARHLIPLIIPKDWKPDMRERVFLDRFGMMLSLVVVFIPGLIQFAHYGTTESLLMMLYMGLVYSSIRLLSGTIDRWKFVGLCGLLTGIALATKVSSLPYVAIPALALLLSFKPGKKSKAETKKTWLLKQLRQFGLIVVAGCLFLLIAAGLGVALSPYNWIAFTAFMGSMTYESGVGFGTILVFYTRSFFATLPVLFQFSRILPFVMGLPLFFLFVLAFFGLSWRKIQFNFVRFSFLLYFLPQAFLYAKWTRFIAPVFPIMALLAALALPWLYVKIRIALKQSPRTFLPLRIAMIVMLFVSIVPGIAFLSIYIKPDVRYIASEWIYDTVPENSLLLAETANVVDIPILPPDTTRMFKNYNYISFDFYNLDTDPSLPPRLEEAVQTADYVIVNSRRVFKNHTCLTPNENRERFLLSIDQTLPLPIYSPIEDQQVRCDELLRTYPRLRDYYDDLFSGDSGFELVAEFTSYPEIRIFGIRLIEFPDEDAEETWTVFDHPVIRIYKRKPVAIR